MSTTKITQAQVKGLRHQVAALLCAVRDFSAGLYAAHGGWYAASQPNTSSN